MTRPAGSSRRRALAAALALAAAGVAAVRLSPGAGFISPAPSRGAARGLEGRKPGSSIAEANSPRAASRAQPNVDSASAGWAAAAVGLVAAAAAARVLGRRSAAEPLSDSKALLHANSTGRVGKVVAGPSLLSGPQELSLQAPLFATRGLADARATGRGARVVANMNKVKRGMFARYKRKSLWLAYSTTYHNRRRNCFRLAKQAVMDSLKKKYKSRRLLKRERRTLWIMRVNALSRLHGVTYSKFMKKMKEKRVVINRKILSQIGIYDRPVFTNIMQTAVPYWKKMKARREYVKPMRTIEEIDNVAIPYIEKCVPELYTDACIRFNRQVRDWGIEYTVDMGNPEEWREALPKMPELANFNLPDHWMGNANAEFETEMSLDLFHQTDPRMESRDYIKFMAQVKKAQEAEEEKAKEGQPRWPTREGVSREDWFKDEPQSWF